MENINQTSVSGGRNTTGTISLFQRVQLIVTTIRYNIKIVFGNKFIYFLIAALVYYLVILGIMLFSGGTQQTDDIYGLLIFPGALIMFYPIVYNIQSDKDARMLEIIFGVPNYRYKVYLVRLLIALMLMAAMIVLLAGIAWLTVVKIPIFKVSWQLMYPMVFVGSLAFMLTTLTRNGNATAVILVIIGLFFLFLSDPLRGSKWNVFLNPFNMPGDMNHNIWMTIVRQNRMMLMIGSAISLLWGLTNLQKREKFV